MAPGAVARGEVDGAPRAAGLPPEDAEVASALERLSSLDFSDCLPEVAEQWHDHIAHLAEAGYFPGVETLYPYLTESPSSLLDHFPEPPLVLLIEGDVAQILTITFTEKAAGEMKERVAAYADAGVQHIMVHPQDREVDDWDTVLDAVGKLAG